MSRFSQEFFWTPAETLAWIRRAVTTNTLWVVVSRVGGDDEVLCGTDLTHNMLHDRAEDTVQLFLGGPDPIERPAWRETRNGRRLLDLPRSCAVHLVPPIVAPDQSTLLQGRLAMLRPSQYVGAGRAKDAAALFRRLRVSMKEESDHERVVVQVLSSSERKIWKDILLGRAVHETTRLKQFAQGAVVFSAARRPAETHEP